MQGKNDIYDIAIIGGGPAGLTAGLYVSRGGMRAVLLESVSTMGQAVMTETIENYPGIASINGFDLVEKMKEQAVKFGLECRQNTVNKVLFDEGFQAWGIEGDARGVNAISVIIASGAKPKKLDVPGETEFTGKGVSYCATCDGAFFRGKNIVVVGGGDTAAEEALFLTRFGKKVTIVHRRGRFRASKVIQDRVFSNKKIEFKFESEVLAIRGGEKVEKIEVKNIKTGKKEELACDGVFLFVGWEPNTAFLKDVVETDEKGGVTTDENMRTSRKGVFAAGDCRRRPLHQVVTACGDGAIAAFSAQKYVEELKGTAYI